MGKKSRWISADRSVRRPNSVTARSLVLIARHSAEHAPRSCFSLFSFHRFPDGEAIAMASFNTVQRKESDNDENWNPPTPDNNFDTRAVHRRAHRLRAWPLDALW